jgi:hypothetical protein
LRRPQVKLRRPTLTALAAVLVLSGPALAKKNNPNIDLEFLPQQSVDAAVADVSGQMLDRPVQIRFVDERKQEDPSKIGVRTDGDDRRHDLKATSDVGDFVEQHLVESAGDWGVRVETEADLQLEVRLLKVDLLETNQAVGATYNATVRIAFAMGSMSGSATGDATRWGKKFSSDNLNEVLSDAMLEAFAGMFSEPKLKEAWER